MLHFIDKEFDLASKTMLISGISIGSLPTLALDHIIGSNGFKRIGFLESSLMQPSVGYLPKNIQNGALGLPAQLYLLDDVLILQFRSTLHFGRKKEFVKQIAQFLKTHQIKDVFLLSSLPVDTRPDYQIHAAQKTIYFKQKGQTDKFIDKSKHEKLILSIDQLKDEEQDEETILKSGGLAEPLLKQCENIVELFMFSSEEEDRVLASYYAKQVAKIIDRKELSQSK